jgi:hypothetical protein
LLNRRAIAGCGDVSITSVIVTNARGTIRSFYVAYPTARRPNSSNG